MRPPYPPPSSSPYPRPLPPPPPLYPFPLLPSPYSSLPPLFPLSSAPVLAGDDGDGSAAVCHDVHPDRRSLQERWAVSLPLEPPPLALCQRRQPGRKGHRKVSFPHVCGQGGRGRGGGGLLISCITVLSWSLPLAFLRCEEG